MPNPIAYLVLLGFPLVAVTLFRLWPVHKAMVWTLLLGHLFMPSGTMIKFPMLPPIDKASMAAVSALILCALMSPRLIPSPAAFPRIGRQIILILLVVILVTPILTVLQNTQPLIYGPNFLPGLRLYDAFGLISQVVVSLIPFWLGLRYLNTREGHEALLQALTITGLIYTIPALVEVRLSPQLHYWIYGFYPFDFVQQIRDGGFRPVVFLNHGLMLGIYLCMSVISALVLYREARREERNAFGWFAAAMWLLLVLVFSKNLGALLITSAFAVIVFFLGRRPQITIAVVLAFIVMLYPMLRGAGWIPVKLAHELALSIDEDRASSLKFRLDNEDVLLTHANEKPISGWGSWGRHAIFDPETGQMTSVTDGIWLIIIGVYGWFGYIGRFGLLTLPILLFALRRSTFGPSYLVPGVIMVLAANLVDLLPNAGLVNYVWLMAGAVAGYVVWQPKDSVDTPVQTAGASPRSAGGQYPTPAKASWLMNETSAAPGRKRRTTTNKGRAM
jgi:hypothetical protein